MSDDVKVRVVSAIRAFVKVYGFAPTVRELAATLEVGHSTVQSALAELAKDGKIRKHSGIARGVVLEKEAR